MLFSGGASTIVYLSIFPFSPVGLASVSRSGVPSVVASMTLSAYFSGESTSTASSSCTVLVVIRLCVLTRGTALASIISSSAMPPDNSVSSGLVRPTLVTSPPGMGEDLPAMLTPM